MAQMKPSLRLTAVSLKKVNHAPEMFGQHFLMESTEPIWKAGKQEYLITSCLFVTSLLVSLDATVLVTALPVGLPLVYSDTSYSLL